MSDAQLAEFMAVTGADETTGLHFLEASGGDLESAVGLFIDRDGGGDAATSSTASNVINASGGEDNVRAPIQAQRSRLVDDFPAMSSLPGGLHPFSRTNNTNVVEPFRNVSNEVLGESDSHLASLFTPPHKIIFKGGWDAAKAAAKKEHKYLLVTLHNPTEFPCQQMIRDHWRLEEIVEFIENNFLFFWMVEGGQEAEIYSSYYKFDDWPHWALLDPRTAKRVLSGGMINDGAEWMASLLEFICEHPLTPPPRKRSAEKEEEEEAKATERKSLASNGTDSDHSNNNNGNINKAIAKERGGDETAPSKSSKSETALPRFAKYNEPQNISDAITIQFRFPDGSKVRARFDPAQSTSKLYDFVRHECQQACVEIRNHQQLIGDDSQQPITKDLKNCNLTVTLTS